MSARVEYNAGSDVRNAGQPSKSIERWFGSLEAAKSEPFPDGCKSAVITSEEGNWLGSKFGSRVDWVQQ